MDVAEHEVLELIGLQALRLHRQGRQLAEVSAELAESKRQVKNLTKDAPAAVPHE